MLALGTSYAEECHFGGQYGVQYGAWWHYYRTSPAKWEVNLCVEY